MLPAIRERRLGKLQICFSSSKKSWDPAALLEYYSLKFRYTSNGGMHMYVNWGGTPRTAVPDCDNPFTEFLRTHPHIHGPFYTYFFAFSSDGQPWAQQKGASLGEDIRAAERLLRGKNEFGTARIGTLVYVPSRNAF